MQNVKTSISAGTLNRWCCFSPRAIHLSSVISFKNYYDILEVPRNATDKQIKSAYYDKAKVYHPDINKNAASSKKFQDVSEAYEILSDPAKKRVYDSAAFGPGPRSTSHGYKSSDYRPYSKSRNPEPINMSHLHYVYRTLNQQPPEEPMYEQLKEHNWPGSEYNKYLYDRRWDPGERKWIYSKKSKSQEKHYYSTMQRRGKIINMCIAVMTLGALVTALGHNFFLKSLANQSSKTGPKVKAGMYLYDDQDMIRMSSNKPTGRH